jgi:hypothetical protein
MIHPRREKPVRHPEQVELAGSNDVLRFDNESRLGRRSAGHDVRHAIDPCEATVAASAKTGRSPGPVKLRASREREAARRDERNCDRLPAIGDEGLTIELDGDGIFRRPKAGHPGRLNMPARPSDVSCFS